MSNNQFLLRAKRSAAADLPAGKAGKSLNDVGGHSEGSSRLIARTIKSDYPIFRNRPELVYLDSAATSQKPQVVIDIVKNFYENYNANVHRGIYKLSEEATELYENSRIKVATFINAQSSNEIIFTGNTNESINLVAYGWARKFLKKDDIIVLSEMEHHANIVPWLRLQVEIGVKLHFLPITEAYRLDYLSLLSAPINLQKVKLVTLTHASNVLGTINPIAEIIQTFKKAGIDAKYLVDAAQSIPHIPIDVQALGCDFLVFSPHKMLGPSGIGILWAKRELLEKMDPLFVGSHMIASVSKEKATWADAPSKFEVGTGKLEAVVGTGAAVDYLISIDFDAIQKHEQELIAYTLDSLSSVNIDLYGPSDAKDRLGVFSFNIKGAHAHDVAQILDRKAICIRSGHHCAQPLMEVLEVPATARASLYLYNNKSDVDKLVEGIVEVKKVLKL